LTQQKLDSLLNLFVYVRSENKIESEKPAHFSREPEKCGFGLVNTIALNIDKFLPEQQSILKVLLQRPILQKSIVTPKGYFRIHYDETGINAPKYSLTELALALDSAYNFEVNFLGYPPPPVDNVNGGDSRYDIYILDLGGSYYGYTQFEDDLGDGKYTSFTVIDNDYQGYYTTGIEGARVTVAHEFHHAIQAGNYIYRESDLFYYEITSTAMEEFVFDDINDYYAYMPDYFNNPTRPFILNSGYNLAIWNIFLKDRFGFDILKRQWELLPSARALNAINISLNENNSTLRNELNRFGVWTYFTNYRSIPGKFFDEAANYPLIRTSTPMVFNPPSKSFSMSTRPTTNYFLKIIDGRDTLISIISNSDFISGTDSANNFFDFEYTLFSDTSVGDRKLSGFYSATLNASPQNFWSATEILNNLVVNGDSTFKFSDADKEIFAFPNPYRYNKKYGLGNFVYIQIQNSELGDEVDFSVFTTSMQLIYNSREAVSFLPNGAKGIKYEVKDSDKKHLGSGVYIYTIKRQDKTISGKFVVFNE
ncbi:MAG: MXAN_6640 family putative metalloprotease, partial [Ignavibacterium sp.]